MIIGIDATNLLQGGGRTHLVELLKAADPYTHGVTSIIVFGSQDTLSLLEDREWLIKHVLTFDDKSYWRRAWWQRYQFDHLAIEYGCTLLFIPGGIYFGKFHPVVTMSQNMLPFEWKELWRYGWSFTTLRLIALRLIQTRSFLHSEGSMFQTEYARRGVVRVTGHLPLTTVIQHGLDDTFLASPSEQKNISDYADDRMYKIVYLSTIAYYKHQIEVIDAIDRLRRETGWPISLELAGPSHPASLRKMQAKMRAIDPDSLWVSYIGAIPYDEVNHLYSRADLGIFASSCETFGIILLEMMASGLPIACSNRGPMLEVLGDAGVYFDPENPCDIASALKRLIDSKELRQNCAQAAYESALKFSWQSCATATLNFLRKAGNIKKQERK